MCPRAARCRRTGSASSSPTSRSRSMTSSGDRSVIAPSSASQRSVKAVRSARPASVRSGQRSSWSCSPIAVANVGLSRKNSARKSSRRLEKSDMTASLRRGATAAGGAGQTMQMQRDALRAVRRDRDSGPEVQRVPAGGSMPGSGRCRSRRARCRDAPEPLLAARLRGRSGRSGRGRSGSRYRATPRAARAPGPGCPIDAGRD